MPQPEHAASVSAWVVTVMTRHADIDREHRYWSRPPMTREELRAFDSSEATVDEIVFASLDALGWND
jgi:hypothetical protein